MARDVEYGYNPNVGLNGLVSINIDKFRRKLGLAYMAVNFNYFVTSS